MVMSDKEETLEEDISFGFTNDLCLFEVIIEIVKEKIYLPRPKARYQKYKHWTDLLLNALCVIFNDRWAVGLHSLEENERASLTFENVTTESDEITIIYVDPKGHTYTIDDKVLASVKFFYIDRKGYTNS